MSRLSVKHGRWQFERFLTAVSGIISFTDTCNGGLACIGTSFCKVEFHFRYHFSEPFFVSA